MKDFIKYDLYRYFGENSNWAFFKAWFKPGFRYTFFLRKAYACKSRSFLGLLYKFFLRKYSYRYGIQIPPGTKIGSGLYIGHFGNIVINDRAILGKNCNIAHGVTIGQTNRGNNKGVPSIGNYVWIGTGSVIVGKIRIGNNVLIAPLSYVNMDIPDNSIVLGNPCKIIERENATDSYINNILQETTPKK